MEHVNSEMAIPSINLQSNYKSDQSGPHPMKSYSVFRVGTRFKEHNNCDVITNNIVWTHNKKRMTWIHVSLERLRLDTRVYSWPKTVVNHCKRLCIWDYIHTNIYTLHHNEERTVSNHMGISFVIGHICVHLHRLLFFQLSLSRVLTGISSCNLYLLLQGFLLWKPLCHWLQTEGHIWRPSCVLTAWFANTTAGHFPHAFMVGCILYPFTARRPFPCG